MGQHAIQPDSTSNIIMVKLRSSSTGQLLTGVAYGSVTAKYQRAGSATATTITLGSGTLGTWGSGMWVETQIAGVYQFGVPDAVVAAGAPEAVITFTAGGAIDAAEVLSVDSTAPTAAENAAAGAGTGDYAVDHNGGTGAGAADMSFYLPYNAVSSVGSSADVLKFTLNGVGAASAKVYAYLASDYDNGTREILAQQTLASNGRWNGSMNLDSGTYYIEVRDPGLAETYRLRLIVP